MTTTDPTCTAPGPAGASALDPTDPVVVRVWRSGEVESVHRGAWARVGVDGELLEGRGDARRPHFARSTIKSLQALPLIESGAAERFRLSEEELALALSSHNAEAIHTDRVRALLGRLGLDVDHLLCGPQPHRVPELRAAAQREGRPASPLDNNCSGKHAGFLALARHLDADPATYLEPDAPVQHAVRQAVAEMCGVEASRLEHGVDGCSAPTFRLSVQELAAGFARVGTPDGLAPERAAACRRMTAAVAAHPALIAGEYKRLCTDLARVTGGRLFPKIGAEGLYCVAHVERGEAFAIKLEDGQARGLHAATVGLLGRFGWLTEDELEALARWRPGIDRNWAGREVGRLEVVQ
ncbi:MAG: asparaginase [Planctomycetota bacterium]